MRSRYLNIALAIVLALSLSAWLFAFYVLGGPFVPYPTIGAVLLLYAPWLVLLVVAAHRWGRKRQSRAVRPAAISLALLMTALLVTYPYWDVLKERAFKAALGSCQARHAVPRMTWEEIPAFDASVRIFRARNDADRRLIACVNQKAGILIDDITCRGGEAAQPGANSALEITSGTTHALQQERFFSVVRYDYPGAADVQLGSVEWCPWQRDL